MSLITRCPACATLFKVVPDQLRISEGWVRCGQCGEIFDAPLHLLAAEAAEREVSLPANPTPAVLAKSGAADPVNPAAQPLDIDLTSVLPGSAVDAVPKSDPELAQVDVPSHDADPSLPSSAADVLMASHAAMDASDRLGDAPIEPPVPVPLRPELPAAVPESNSPPFGTAAGSPPVSFLRRGPPDVFWRKPLMRATLGLLSGVLLLGLAGQFVAHERDRLAAAQPGLKPWLLRFCDVLDCTVSALRRIEAVAIESSSFSRIKGDSYRLNFTLKNSASTALALPAIELTLTDAMDQPVARRVFLAGEFGAATDTLEAGAEWPASATVVVQTAAVPERVTGYRLLAFYP